MKHPFWSGEASRQIRKRVVIEADLLLETPACLGAGDGDSQVDMPLLVDPLDGRTPLLTGASLAGALRAYLHDCECGYGASADQQETGSHLFGGQRADKDGRQSALIIDEALGKEHQLEMRQEVGLDPQSRTSAQDRLFNRELWTAGTRFPLRLELVVGAEDDEARLLQSLATALHGLEAGEIFLGARKRRGYGACRVTEWRVRAFDFARCEDLIAWIEQGDAELASGVAGVAVGADIHSLLDVAEPLADQRRRFRLTAMFDLDGSLLMAGTDAAIGPDKQQAHSLRPGRGEVPVAPGTGLAGALRARARAIAQTLAADDQAANALVEEVFGPKDIGAGKAAYASPLRVAEAVIEGGSDDWVQCRIRLDRWTGGVLPGALFNAQPMSGGQLALHLELRQPQPHQIGLLLLLLKDLWLGDLPLGAEIGSGRGRLTGREAQLGLTSPETDQHWRLVAEPASGELAIEGEREALEAYVSQHLHQWLREGPQDRPQQTENSVEGASV
ncbi:hypothetical protein CKO42_17225 [Lamprobacter modestohalophilus]|uniref:CRISPR type III-associated protein domain-containing protein n=1 Tax=Lamprobacter modestohalophilus TaxID=1064514 RepID=A0A9X0WAZ4_9GAMM|nr:RAMP superfamily CRISPR-associated protein [Lamprobacter modestohalophilus]MBK1620151.1 hypothetical protein [Lamprobacter modestohalophilus]